MPIFFRNKLVRFCVILFLISLVFLFTVKNKPAVSNHVNNVTSAKPSHWKEEKDWVLGNANIPELPSLLKKVPGGPKGLNGSCAKYPDLYKIHFSNVHWQVQATEVEQYYFYSAYLDTRGTILLNPDDPFDNSTLRIIGMSTVYKMKEKNSTLKYCQYWFQKKTKPVFKQISTIQMLWHPSWGRGAHYYPYLISCALPTGLRELPISVSLVPTECSHATNNLNIFHRSRDTSLLKSTPKKDFAICVKALDLPNPNAKEKLMEWIEIVRLLGADKIFFYEYFIHSEIKKILDHYETQGIIELAKTSMPGELPNQPQLRHLYVQKQLGDKRLTELVPYNDCFLKNMYDYKYILIMDTDEIIMPVEEINWSKLLQNVKQFDLENQKLSFTTFCFRNFYFMDSMLDGKEDQVSHIPKQFHMLRNIFRGKEFTGRGFMKCFHSTDEGLGVHNHFGLFCRDKKRCVRHHVDDKRAQLNHYRSTCVKEITDCGWFSNETVRDTKLWRYKDKIITRVTDVLNALEN